MLSKLAVTLNVLTMLQFHSIQFSFYILTFPKTYNPHTFSSSLTMDVSNLLDQFDSLKIQNTDNLDGPRRFIRTQIFNGYTPATALKNLYYYFTGTTLDASPDMLQKCFIQAENNDFSQIPENFHLAF